MFGDSNSSALQEQVLDLTDRIYNSWINWVRKGTDSSAVNIITAAKAPYQSNWR